MNNFLFNLGDQVKDKITGFTGIVRVRSQYLTGCNVYGVQSQKLKADGEKSDWLYFDEGLISLVKKQKIKIADHNPKAGGPHSLDQFPPKR